MDILRLQRDIADVDPEIVGTLLGVPFANSTLMLLFIVCVTFGLIFMIKRFTLLPNTFQSVVEYLFEGIEGLIDQITGSRERTRDIFSLIGALFVFIGFANILPFIPGLMSFTYNGVQLFRIPTSDFNTTFALAVGMLLVVQVVSIMEWGVFGYLGKFFKFRELATGFRKGIGEGFTALIEFFVGLLDIISEVAKVISLSLRLFGNLYAGEVLAVLVLGAFAFILPAAWMSLNMLFAIVQTLVFALLVTAYYELARKPENS